MKNDSLLFALHTPRQVSAPSHIVCTTAASDGKSVIWGCWDNHRGSRTYDKAFIMKNDSLLFALHTSDKSLHQVTSFVLLEQAMVHLL